MAAAAYVDHFAAECLVSMSSRAVVHEPREGTEPRPEGAAAAAPTLPRVDERRDGKDSASLFVVARILADLNQQAPAPAPEPQPIRPAGARPAAGGCSAFSRKARSDHRPFWPNFHLLLGWVRVGGTCTRTARLSRQPGVA
nr:Krueppel-like factor 13 [Peromyscus maniculatus bairdii]